MNSIRRAWPDGDACVPLIIESLTDKDCGLELLNMTNA